MARRRSFTSDLYKAARIADNLSAASRGQPALRCARRLRRGRPARAIRGLGRCGGEGAASARARPVAQEVQVRHRLAACTSAPRTRCRRGRTLFLPNR